MSNKLCCPLCSKIVTASPFKSWQFGKFQVKRFECTYCKSKFNLYQSRDRTFTIPKPK